MANPRWCRGTATTSPARRRRRRGTARPPPRTTPRRRRAHAKHGAASVEASAEHHRARRVAEAEREAVPIAELGGSDLVDERRPVRARPREADDAVGHLLIEGVRSRTMCAPTATTRAPSRGRSRREEDVVLDHPPRGSTSPRCTTPSTRSRHSRSSSRHARRRRRGVQLLRRRRLRPAAELGVRLVEAAVPFALAARHRGERRLPVSTISSNSCSRAPPGPPAQWHVHEHMCVCGRAASDDGGAGGEYSVCTPCTDCDDCGPRLSGSCLAAAAEAAAASGTGPEPESVGGAPTMRQHVEHRSTTSTAVRRACVARARVLQDRVAPTATTAASARGAFSRGASPPPPSPNRWADTTSAGARRAALNTALRLTTATATTAARAASTARAGRAGDCAVVKRASARRTFATAPGPRRRCRPRGGARVGSGSRRHASHAASPQVRRASPLEHVPWRERRMVDGGAGGFDSVCTPMAAVRRILAVLDDVGIEHVVRVEVRRGRVVGLQPYQEAREVRRGRRRLRRGWVPMASVCPSMIFVAAAVILACGGFSARTRCRVRLDLSRLRLQA